MRTFFRRIFSSAYASILGLSASVALATPTISITSPSSGSTVASITSPAGISITATASPTTGASLSSVQFFVNGASIGTVGGTSPFSITWQPTSAGTQTITATVTDNSVPTTGTTPSVNTATATSIVTLTQVQTTSVISPTNGATFAQDSEIFFRANATISDAIIGQVEFLVDGVPVAVRTQSPFNSAIVLSAANGFTVGPHILSARATSSDGGTVILSPNVTINIGAPVSGNLPPVVAITAPSSGTNVTVNQTVSLAATATDADGFIPSTAGGGVTFFVDGDPVVPAVAGETNPKLIGPYTVTWRPTFAKTYSIRAMSLDDRNRYVLSTPVLVTAQVASTPSVLSATVTSPVPGTVVQAGAPIPIVASATPGPGALVSQVQFLVNNSPIGVITSPPYSINWTPTVTGTAPTNFNLAARVLDTLGGNLTSSSVTVTAVPGLSSVSLSSPSAGSTVSVGGATTLSATTRAGSGSQITGVQFYLNGTLLGAGTAGTGTASGTHSFSWTPQNSGDVNLEVRATDSTGAIVTTGPIQVTVLSGAPPTMALSLSPSTSTTLPQGASRYLVATPTAASGRAIERVEFFIDGARVQESLTPPYTYRFVAPASSGSAAVLARATDNGGLTGEAQVTFSFLNAVGTAPTVNLIAPTPNTIVTPGTTVPLIASALDADGTVVSVQFYARGVPQGAADTTSPYQGNFAPPTPGVYTIEAVATDDRGNTTTSNVVNITAAFLLPTINIVSPSTATTARATPNVPLTVTAAALGGGGASVLLVEFLVDGVPIATRTAPASGSNFSFQWTPLPDQLGAHVITARVTDANSQAATSAPLNVTVATLVGVPPTVTIAVSPSANNLQTASTVNFTANAVANGTGNALTGVEFFLNDVSIGTAAREQTTNVYRLAYNFGRFDFSSITPTVNEATGAVTYPLRLYAIARDSNNNQTVSSTSNLILNPATSTPPTLQLQALSPTTITTGTPFLIAPIFDDLDGVVVAIQLFANGSNAGAALTNPQLGQILTYNATTAGRFNLYAVATDDTGNTIVSSPTLVVNVTAISAPTTAITRPSDNSTVTTVGAPVFLEGTATNAGSTQVPTMQFVVTGSGGARTALPATRVGTTTTYRATWTPTVADTFTLSTQATVGTVSGTSPASRRVVVTNLQGLGPIVTLTVPNTATTGSTSNFTASATDSDGSVIEVEFFLNRNSIGLAQRDQQTNTWRLTASFAGVPLGAAEVVALARDSSGNVAASPTSTVNVTAASSIGPSITITPSTTDAAFSRQVQLTANARDADGTVASVQYFANATSLGTSTNAGTNYQVNWTPTQSGIFNLWALATDNSGITTVAATVPVTVRRNNPVLEDAAFILQTYQDIANTTTINAFVFADLDARLGNGSISRADVVASLVNETGFVAPVNLLVAYQVIMGQWPTPQNYTALLATARTNLPNAIGAILASPEYFSKYGTVPTVALLNTPSSAIPARTLLARLHANAGLNAPSDLDLVRFMNNDSTAGGTLGRGYNVAGLNTALAEFVTNTNANNTGLRRNAQTAALYYQLNRPSLAVTPDQITARVAVLAQLPDPRAVADAALKDILYTYRYVTITKHPESLTVAPRSGVLFSVEAMGAPPLAYQWLLNGAPIAGANEAILSLTNVDVTRVGAYTAVVTSSAGLSISDPATLTLSTAPTRLANISTRGVTAAGANVLIGGFVVTGNTPTQTRQMLIRVVGPRLGAAPFNLPGFLPNPRLEVYRGTNPVPILTNDNWGTQTGGTQLNAIQQATTRAGAFALANNSADAVVLATLAPGPYTVLALAPEGSANASGVVLIEVYDVTTGNAVGPKAANVSTRGQVGTGNNVLIAGFVVNGTVSRRMLIRGAGPTLSRLGVPDVLADPQITLVAQSSGLTLRTNNDWASGDDAAIIASAASTAGAFPFANGSRDSAMIIMLPPGAYTVQLSGVNNTTGVGIVEVYDVDP